MTHDGHNRQGHGPKNNIFRTKINTKLSILSKKKTLCFQKITVLSGGLYTHTHTHIHTYTNMIGTIAKDTVKKNKKKSLPEAT